MLKSDQQGFLIGEVLDVSKAMLEGQRAGLQVLSRIDANVAAMIQGPRRVSRPRTTDPATFFSNAPAIEPAPRRSSPLIRPAGPVSSTPVTPSRDSKGRFVKGAGGNSPGPDKPGPSERPAPDEARSNGENRIVEAIKEAAAQSSDRMDPMIEAAKEVWEPMGRGWRASFGQTAEKKKERWYKRIWLALNKRRDDQKGGSVAPGGSSSSSMIPGLLGGVASRFGGVLSGVPGLLGKAGTGIMGRAGGLIKRLPLLGAAGGVLKRVPLLGGLVAGGSALYGALKGDDPALSRDENRTKRYRGVGGALGMGAGGVAGAAMGSLLGPIGTIAGGALGAHLGEKAGAAIGELAKDVPEKIAEISKSRVVTEVVESAKSGAAAAGQFVTENALRIVPDMLKKAAGMGANAFSLMVAAMKGGISDPAKLALFMGNMSHESGGFTSLEEKFNYSPARLRKVFGKKYFPSEQSAAEAVAGGPEKIAEIVYGGRMGNSSPGDGYKFRGRGFIQLTGKDNYAAAGNAIGVDLLKNPDLAAQPDIASKIAVWFWNKRVASRGMDGSVASSRKAINGGLNGLDDTVKRVEQFSTALGVASASAPQISIPASRVSSSFKAIEAPPDVNFGPVVTPQEKQTVLRGEAVSQNVSDRAIAHIATGGLGGGAG